MTAKIELGEYQRAEDGSEYFVGETLALIPDYDGQYSDGSYDTLGKKGEIKVLFNIGTNRPSITLDHPLIPHTASGNAREIHINKKTNNGALKLPDHSLNRFVVVSFDTPVASRRIP